MPALRPKVILAIVFLCFFSLGMGPKPKPQPADTTPPQVSITAPANNSTVSGSVNIQATATDNVGVAKVEFYVDNSLKSTDTTSPYAYSWDTTTATNASHALKAIAYDAKNNSKQAQINVTVNNAVLPADPELAISSTSASGSNASHPASATADKNTSTYWQGN
ncbi:MAG: Ig-like domain-containing protein [Candidatus Omnitrophota bacterium]|nr:Ig-like domain-containing protein [Candidatus Omnitrophota bacterium]